MGMPRSRTSGRLASGPVVRKAIIGVVVAGVVTLGLSLPAGADPGCYTGCSPSPTNLIGLGPSTLVGGPAVAPSAPVPGPSASAPAPGGLPFTGADIEQTVAVACVLLVAGAAMVRIRRRSRATS